jgi:hypothetical protein
LVYLGLAVTPSIPDDGGRERNRSESGAIAMAHDLIDSTLPAHDPNFPKPRGLLPVPPEVAEYVAAMEARLLRERGIQITPEARRDQLDYATMNWYYDNSYVAFRRTPEGIEVLAVGSEEIHHYLKDHPPEMRQGVVLGVA